MTHNEIDALIRKNFPGLDKRDSPTTYGNIIKLLSDYKEAILLEQGITGHEFEKGGIVSGCKPMSMTDNCEYIIPKKR